MSKQKLRRLLRKERAAVAQRERADLDQKISIHLRNWSAYKQARKVMIYLSFGWEIETRPLVSDLLEQGKKVFVPVVQKQKRLLIPTSYTWETVLVSGDFGIQEPISGETIAAPLLDLIVVPGLAFSPAGYRLGYGGGYYDRFLLTTPARRVGLCYSQFIRELPRDAWDEPVHFLATEMGVSEVK